MASVTVWVGTQTWFFEDAKLKHINGGLSLLVRERDRETAFRHWDAYEVLRGNGAVV